MDTRRDSWRLVVAAGLVVFAAQLDTAIVTVALPTIARDLGSPPALAQWVLLAYVVPLVGLGLLAGRWLDAVDRRAALVLSVTGFALSSAAAGASPTVAALIVARLVQGGFAAVLLAVAPVLAVEAVSAGRRGRALGLVSTLAPLGAVAGPALGGILVQAAGWPMIFYLNVPLGVLILVVGRARAARVQQLRPPARAAVVDAALVGAAAGVVLLALSLATTLGWPWLALAPLAVPLVVMWQHRASTAPARGVLGAPGMPGVHVALLCSYTALFIAVYLAPFYLQDMLRTGPTVAGLTLLAYPAASATVGLAAGALTDRLGAPAVAAAGAVLVTAGLALVAADPGSRPLELAWRLAVVGVGFGLFLTSVQTLAMTAAPADLRGTTAATTNLARQTGIGVGPALATAVWAATGYTASGLRLGLALAVVPAVAAVLAVLRARTPVPSDRSAE